MMMMVAILVAVLATAMGRPLEDIVVSRAGSSALRLVFKQPTTPTTITTTTTTTTTTATTATTLSDDFTVTITSSKDGYSQVMDKTQLIQWGFTSAYFNGDRVSIRFGHVDDILEIDQVMTSYPSDVRSGPYPIDVVGGGDVDSSSICGRVDQRYLSDRDDTPRFIYGDMNGCCTAWPIDDAEHCFLSAGHCTGGSAPPVLQWKVPLSDPVTGELNHPPPEHQFAVDTSSMQSQNAGLGSDWRYFGVFPDINGTHPFEKYGRLNYTLADATAPFPDADTTLEIVGYGENESNPPEERRVQKTAQGAFVSGSGNVLRHQVDTSNGNSGGPVKDLRTGLAVAIHTHGGCSPSGGSNGATAIRQSNLQNALNNPRGVCRSATSSVVNRK
jgi:hypothetical protein